ncbi:MAG: UDP-glucose 4-epimerase GalE [Alphaproteobacteria bacterium]|nr:UDP-glucose 4-epimerase GalE [Alphaproteobacteria bacterium]
MRTLLIGGAGYIGSAIAYRLLDRGHTPVVYDDLSTGFREAVPSGVPFVQGDTGDAALLAQTIKQQGIEAAIHLAAHIRVDESVAEPAKYYANNTVKALTVFDTLARNGVRDVVFSSTAAVYGAPEHNPIDEAAPQLPVNPYGGSKLASEFILKDLAAAHGLRATIFRYFNVAGADLNGRSGQRTKEATHLIKVAAEVATGRRPVLQIYGDDYPTRDGTCVRDYIHVTDLADAHIAALAKPGNPGETRIYNCGYGTGHTVKEVVAMFGEVLGRPLPVQPRTRRPGDPPALVCDSRKLQNELGWRPEVASLRVIVETALRWEQRNRA